MRALDRKLLRDLLGMKGQMTAIAVVMACGLMVMIMERGLIVSLEGEKRDYYGACRLADLFCDLKRAPNTLADRFARVPDVVAAETRVRGSAILDLPGMRDLAEALVLSIPDTHPPRLNLLHLRAGRLPSSKQRGETVISEAFAEAHGFRPGDTIDATIHGGRETLRIVGIAISPEFVYELPPGGIMPDNRRYGVFWMSETELARALGLEGAFNSLALDVAPGGDPQAVKAAVDRILAPYGGLSAYDRSEYPSIKMVDDEIRGLHGAAVAFPTLFLSVAAFMTSAALSRLVRQQREQIAQLKAFGYSSLAIGTHYLKYMLVVTAAATLAGGALGLWAGSAIVGLYKPFFRFPSLPFLPDWPALAEGLLLAAGFSVLGVLHAVRQAVILPPAEAMRPESPAAFRPSAVERLGFQTLVSPAFRMALRHMERKPWQAFFTLAGLSIAAALPIVAIAMGDGMDYMMDFQWRLAQRQDVTLSLIETGSEGALHALGALPGVLGAEPFRAVPARLRFAHRARRVAVTGLPPTARLNRLLDVQGKQVEPPRAGLLLSAQLAEILGVHPGDTLRMEVQEGARPRLDVLVAGTITDYAGVGAYMDLNALRRLMREGETIDGAQLEVDETRWSDFLGAVKASPHIGSITVTRAARESYARLSAQMMAISQAIFFCFAVIIAFGVIYNGARIALSENTRDLATLRVLGFSEREVASVLIGELALLTLLALPPGFWAGNALTHLLMRLISSETMRIPAIVTREAYATAALIVLLSSLLSFLAVGRRVARLDLLDVLKARE